MWWAARGTAARLPVRAAGPVPHRRRRRASPCSRRNDAARPARSKRVAPRGPDSDNGGPNPHMSRHVRCAQLATSRRRHGDHVFLVDGSSYIFRAYHALPPLTRKSDGLPVGAVLGFCNMLWKLLRDMKPEERPTHLAVIFDKSEKTFRNEIYPDYKAHRPPAPDDLVPQFPLIREAVRAFDMPCLEQGGFEADDLIATYAREACEARRHRDHRVLRQGPDAARQRLRHHVRHHEGQAASASPEVIEKFGVPPEQGGRGAGADRRFDRQRAGRAGHRRQDRGAADRRIWRPRNAAGARRRDQAAEAPRER